MEMWWIHQLLLLPLIAVIAFAATDVDLKNPDFESPPSNIPSSNSSIISLLPLNASLNTIPGWSFKGPVAYVTNSSGDSPDGILSLPAGSGSHAIYLGREGLISQTIKGTEQSMNYILTVTILGAAQNNCNVAGNVLFSISGMNASYSHSFDQNVFGMGQWEIYGIYLGSHGNGELLDLILECPELFGVYKNPCRGPILDSLMLKRIADPVKITENNLLVNGGFEMGPASFNNSFNGILMVPAPNATRSPLIQWVIKGTMKYITSNKNYVVPQGNAAIELAYGDSNGIETSATLEIGSTYKLQFFIGDANEGCVGKFIVGVQAGSTSKNFTHKSRGKGSAQRFSMTFQADSIVTPIGFQSFELTQTRDFVYCGPMIDDVVLLAYSHGMKLELPFMFILSCLIFLVTIL